MIKPSHDFVLVKPDEPDKLSKGGIYLPESAKEKPQQGKVIAVGPGRVLENGTTYVPPFKKGEFVLYKRYGGQDIEVEGKEYLLIEPKDIIATID
ncbi:MAG TPA: co-chaperone GroES [Planctomycetaceae bacterium]|jgi:chaperonin GroES|nr:co-chaperone GroES [Planctomycetaceae bacterium]